jgi:DNA polymerase-3 subunit epsilon
VQGETLSVPLDRVIFAVLDVETTGLSPAFGDRICEVAVLRCRGGRELARFHTLVNPLRSISPGAFAVNHIRDEDVIDAPLFRDVAPRLLEALGDSVIVAHNAPFDLGFLAWELGLGSLPPVENPIVDTLALARRCYSFPSNSLQNVAYYLGIDTQGEHRALADVVTTKGVLDRFLADLADRGVHTLGDVLEAQGGDVLAPGVEVVALPPQIDEALRTEGRLELRYVSAWGEETQRVVKPLYVAAYGGNLYLRAFCHLRNGERTFRLDRIIEMRSEGVQ